MNSSVKSMTVQGITGPESDESLKRKNAMDQLIRSLVAKDTRRIAIFLGAGASKLFGYPLTRDLLLMILEGLKSRRILLHRSGDGELVDHRKLLNFLTRLLPGERLTRESLPLVTGVLSLLDFALATGQVLLPGTTIAQTREIRRLLELAILEVIPDQDDWSPTEERDFKETKFFLQKLLKQKNRSIALITTNYDMLSDQLVMRTANVALENGYNSLKSLARKVDFGFRWVNPDIVKTEVTYARPERARIALYKLHGSTNWLRCPLCENIYINPAGPISLLASRNSEIWDNECHCSETKLETQIVPPSFIRDTKEPNLIAIWKNTLDYLREANHWLLIGYSFPDEDVAIRALITRAYGAKRTHHPKVSVLQLDDSARANYESFFPPGHFDYLTGGMRLFLDRVKAARLRRASEKKAS